MKNYYAVYSDEAAAIAAAESCNDAYAPRIIDPVTKRWALVEPLRGGWGFRLPAPDIWTPKGDAILVEEPLAF